MPARPRASPIARFFGPARADGAAASRARRAAGLCLSPGSGPRGAMALERQRLAGALEDLMTAEEANSIDLLLADGEGLHQITTLTPQSGC